MDFGRVLMLDQNAELVFRTGVADEVATDLTKT